MIDMIFTFPECYEYLVTLLCWPQHQWDVGSFEFGFHWRWSRLKCRYVTCSQWTKTREFSFKLFSVMFIHPPGNASFCARFNAATRDVSGTYANSIQDLIQIASACRNDNIRPEVILSKDLLHFLCKRIAHSHTTPIYAYTIENWVWPCKIHEFEDIWYKEGRRCNLSALSLHREEWKYGIPGLTSCQPVNPQASATTLTLENWQPYVKS